MRWLATATASCLTICSSSARAHVGRAAERQSGRAAERQSGRAAERQSGRAAERARQASAARAHRPELSTRAQRPTLSAPRSAPRAQRPANSAPRTALAPPPISRGFWNAEQGGREQTIRRRRRRAQSSPSRHGASPLAATRSPRSSSRAPLARRADPAPKATQRSRARALRSCAFSKAGLLGLVYARVRRHVAHGPGRMHAQAGWLLGALARRRCTLRSGPVRLAVHDARGTKHPTACAASKHRRPREEESRSHRRVSRRACQQVAHGML